MVRKRDVFLACMFALHVTLDAQSPAARVDPSECRSLMDLYFVIDGSDSIDRDNFNLLREAIASMIPETDLGQNKARIGMLVYSSHVPETSEHIFSYDPGYLYKAAMTLEHPRDGTNTRLGIKHMKKIFKDHGRPGVPWVCVVITDGISKNPPATIKEAKEAAEMGISMFAVGVGYKIAIQELEAIASTEQQVIAINDFSELRYMLKSMMFRICPCPVPPTVELAKCNDGPRAIGSVRTYQCMDGYVQRGNPDIQCQSDFTWTSLSPDFECVPCGQTTPVVEHGTCSGGLFTIGAVRTYTCDTGYRGIGNPNIECLTDARWSIPAFECVPCGSTPVIPHAVCGGDDFKIGAVRTFTCETGYRLIGRKTIECVDHKDWVRPQWSKPDVQCIPCGDIPVVPHGMCGGDDFRIGAVRAFTCEPGYRLTGKATIECLDHKDWKRPQWSKPDVQCIPCGDIPVVPHGMCGGDDFRIGAVRAFTCEPGYRLIGKATIQCLDHQDWRRPQWSKPDVQCIPCGETPVVPHGMCGGDDFRIGAVRAFTCEPGYRLTGKATIECLDHNDWRRPRWSKPDVQCVPCGDTPVVSHGMCGGDDFRIGAVRAFTCEPGYRLIGKATIECIDHKDWKRPQWSKPDVQCIPCGDIPVVPHGMCGGDDFRIGAVRAFTCEPGYRLIGKATIQCLDHNDWRRPQWSKPDVQCVPCAETPVVPHGMCGGDDFRIGAVRAFTCEPGYRLTGKATIECLDHNDWRRPRWSKPDVQCVPCGDTPVVPHGMCGGDDFRIGAVRAFTCEPGYRLIGKKTIECLDHKDWRRPQWSKPDVQCVPCGEIPVVPNGMCGGDDFRIGAVRAFTCEPGYRLIGKATIECIDHKDWKRPQWSKPDVQCIPCGDIPVVLHGMCGGDDFRIGAVRAFTCEPGYRLIGKATIECLDHKDWRQPQWSKPDVQCVPCGDTPVVPYGMCGGDDFRIGAVRAFTCEPGYRLIGKSTIECIDHKDWKRPQWSKPDVQCIPCGDIPVVPHGMCGGDDFRIGAVRAFTCEPGYRLIGKATIECLDHNDWRRPQWSKPDVQCVPCAETPVVPHGMCGGDDFRIGAVRAFTCEPGYRLIGKATIECLDHKDWKRPQWSKPDVQCIPCGDIPVVPHGMCGGDDFRIGAVRAFTCEPGYRLTGKATIECLDHNDWRRPRWSKPDVQCVPCGDTPVVPHGMCGGDDFRIGAVRAFTCEPGYRLIGKKTIECLDHKDWRRPQWSKPDVQCVPCGEIPVVPNGMCGGDDFRIGAVRAFTCEPGYRLIGKATIECIDHKDWKRPQWSKPDVQCIPCGDIPVVPHGMCGGDDFRIGAVRAFTCEPGYRLIGKATIQCLDHKDWRQPQWSKPDVQCIPCGDIPVVPHGMCGGDDFRIGAVRAFTCEPGYRLIGKATIECLDHNDWRRPQWSKPDVQCVPCAETPVVPHGMCGGDDFRIGAVRAFTCEPGYRLIGKATIECLDHNDWRRPRWSKPDVQCIPCGDIPVVPHGMCGGDDFRIGAVRAFTCEPGYRLIGKATIECLDHNDWRRPRWSKLDVQCVPCAGTPVVPHGMCGGDDFRIGAVRAFTCEPGYRLIGKATIECLDHNDWRRPRWSKLDVQCIPCGDTPVVPHGMCGGDDFRIGAVRAFTCEPGYRLTGKATIECLDHNDWRRPRWSKPDAQCVPCGDTPVVPHGMCGGDDFRIGAVRAFTCEPGYRLIGKKTIECLDHKDWRRPQWSKPDVQCVPCGEIPVVPNGMCGGDDFRIGAVRAFTCEPGYRLIGKATIECIDHKDLKRPQWSKPDVQCVPCGEIPVVPRGMCGGDDFRIGAVRAFTCEPGYRLIGKATIECLDHNDWRRPQWSKPEVQCVPCGKTPEVEHATCDKGDNRIGSLRSYTCASGYHLDGKPQITCLDDGTWSEPRFTCKDCGDPPFVQNAYTGTGPSLIGSKRVYYCESGFDMIGRGEVTCDGNGRWEAPRFSCKGKPPKPIPNDPSVCDGCRYLNGVGYNRHPFDCNQYVQCFRGNKGFEPIYQKCPFGLFWDQNVLTCRRSEDVDCPHDQCKDLSKHSYKHTDRENCCAYWKCQNGRSYGECCGDGSSYDPTQQQCVTDVKCVNTCPFENEISACDKRPGFRDTMFEQHIGNNYWVPMHCAGGTAFNPVDCECSLLIMNVPGKRRQQVCKPELYLPFKDGFNDRSGKNVYVKPENVSIQNGAAYFNGHSRILINRFANTEFAGDLVIKFRYNEFRHGEYFHKLQALVTNGDCGSDPSIVLAKMPGYVLLGAKADVPRSFALPTLDKEWKEVIYIHNGKKLEGKVCGASMGKWSYGPIKATHCAVQIGYGNGLQSYVGLIDDLYIYQCRPRAKLLNINY